VGVGIAPKAGRSINQLHRRRETIHMMCRAMAHPATAALTISQQSRSNRLRNVGIGFSLAHGEVICESASILGRGAYGPRGQKKVIPCQGRRPDSYSHPKALTALPDSEIKCQAVEIDGWNHHGISDAHYPQWPFRQGVHRISGK